MTKFNPAWQLTRLKARKVKDVDQKINLVLQYYKMNQTKADLSRVLNWLRTTSMAYKSSPLQQQKFNKAMNSIVKDAPVKYDNESKLTDLSKQDAQELLKDLKTRKYNFQFKSTPADHIKFVNELEQYIAS